MRLFAEFATATQAREYRHTHGTGGWIFEDEATGSAVIFPPDMTPTGIMLHAMTRGKSGNLIGCG